MAASNRSRTGCLTCRKRKLKCDETKPVCKNCQKSSRPCEPAPAIAFRNQQNPSLNAEDGQAFGIHNLKNFYKYAETFRTDNVWVETPASIQFVYITDPYADDPAVAHSGPSTHAPVSQESGISSVQQNTYAHVPSITSPTLHNKSYQDLASHSLHALSHAATSQNAPFVPQGSSVPGSSQPVKHQEFDKAPTTALPEHVKPSRRRIGRNEKAAVGQIIQGQSQGQNNAIGFMLNPPSTVATVAAAAASAMANIDPDLERMEGATEQGGQHTEGASGELTSEEQLAQQLQEATEQQ